MKKHFYCLFLAFFLISSWHIVSAFGNGEIYSGCCKPPQDKWVGCDQLPYNFDPKNTYQLQSLFGKAENKCYAGLVVELTPSVYLNSCGIGTIVRKFQASNNYGSYDYCEQTVTIEGAFDYKLRFPADEELTCGESPASANPRDIIIEESACDLLVVSIQDHFFSTGTGQCGKIFRTFRVINWCEYDGESQPVIIDRDEDCDGKPGDEDVWVIRRPEYHAYVDRDDNEKNTNPKAGERRTCSPSNPKGYWRTAYSKGFWQYTQHIKIGDNVAPTISTTQPQPFCSINNNCDALVEIPFSVDDICTPNDIKIKVFFDGQKTAEFSKGGSYTASGRYKLGTHELEIHATDGCGNSTVKKLSFTVIDCKAPAPICLSGITATLMPTPPDTDADGDGDIDPAAMEVWVSDILKSQTSDCSGLAGYSINRVGETPDINKKSLVLTCDDLGTLDIGVYAWDNAYNPQAIQPDSSVGGPNYTHCKTYILVQINNNRCDLAGPGIGSISGSVHTEGNYGLKDVNIMLVSNDSAFLLTEQSGSYRFDSIPMLADYKVVPSLNSNTREGISLVDLILLQKHVLGIELIRSPYRLIAADINRDGRIDNDDVIELRNVLIGVQSEFTANNSWRFVDASYFFPNPLDPWQEEFPEYISIARMNNAENYGDFVAIKIGDINGSVVADRLSIESRSNEHLNLNIVNQLLTSGAIVKIPVFADLTNVEALQFSLQYNSEKLDLKGIESDIIESHNIIRQDAFGLIHISWDNLEKAPIDKDQPLFYLILQANESVNLDQAIRLNARWAAPAAYKNENIATVHLSFEQYATENNAPILYQNAPNPFQSETTIAFELPEATAATLRIHDLNGKEIWRFDGYFNKGYHQMKLHQEKLNAHGVLIYSLETNLYKAMKKMIVLP
ncbi:MAG: hypothetical protein IPJ74_12420 [Saprospiraceae bacterium]|nr:hypothetical protein [Saprospiraceae bacterium]